MLPTNSITTRPLFIRYRLILPVLCSLLFSSFSASPTVQAQGSCISLVTLGSAYTQDFNTLSNTVGSNYNSLTLTGWHLTESGGGARDNELYAVGTGSDNVGTRIVTAQRAAPNAR